MHWRKPQRSQSFNCWLFNVKMCLEIFGRSPTEMARLKWNAFCCFGNKVFSLVILSGHCMNYFPVVHAVQYHKVHSKIHIVHLQVQGLQFFDLTFKTIVWFNYKFTCLNTPFASQNFCHSVTIRLAVLPKHRLFIRCPQLQRNETKWCFAAPLFVLLLFLAKPVQGLD